MSGEAPLSTRAILLTTVVLLVLTGLSWGLAYVPLGAWEVPVALGIAVVKVLFVAFIFMHLYREPPSVRFVAAMAPLFIALLVGFVVADVLTRLEPG
jgi:cytochrome c oxidase subunit IV